MMLSLLAAAALAGLPLTESTYDVVVTGPYADITLEQTFTNDSDEWIAATYIFPLPHDGAVDAMTMRIRELEIVGVIQDKEAAREQYEQAVAAGQAAALTEQERDNVFTQRVGNIPPGEDITVRIHVVQPVDRIPGGWEIAIPLVVGPRFSPDTVPDAPRITPPVAEHDTGHRVRASFAIDTGNRLSTLGSPTHGEAVVHTEGAVGFINLTDLTATRDIVVRWTHEVDEPVASAVVQSDHLLVSFEPPEAPSRDQIVPRELIWVIDTSCSQDGVPLAMSKQAMKAALAGMDGRDSFALLQFDNDMRWWREGTVAASANAVAEAADWVDALTAQGGTNMIGSVYGALDLPADPERERYVVFLTDGFIGNERDVLGALDDLHGGAKVFTFGLGSSVNRWLIDEMARTGSGAATFVTLDESPEQAVAEFLDTISRPVLSDVSIDWGDLVVSDIYPQHLPDLFAGAPLDVVARVEGGAGPITISGRLGDGWYEHQLDVRPSHPLDAHAVATTWARRKIAALEREQHWGEIDDVKQEIIDLSMSYDVLTRYTSFVAVQQQAIRHDGELRSIEQPSEIPDGVSFETTVSRPYTPPGDPLLTVTAPFDSRMVLVAYPWGQSAVLRWDDLRGRWYHRFLVPRDIEDSVIDVVIYVVDAEGTIERRVETITVDGEAPKLEGEVHVLNGKTRIVIYCEEPLRLLRVYPVGMPEVAVRRDLGLHDDSWEHIIEIAGEYPSIEVVAKDRAMNTLIDVIR